MFDIETERRNRIRVSVAAYAYEVRDHSIMSDAEFDALALKINPEISTGNTELDLFFREKFNSYTGSWIFRHPDLHGIIDIYIRYYAKDAKYED